MHGRVAWEPIQSSLTELGRLEVQVRTWRSVPEDSVRNYVQTSSPRCVARAHPGVVVWVWGRPTVALVSMPWHPHQRSDVGAPVLARTRWLAGRPALGPAGHLCQDGLIGRRRCWSPTHGISAKGSHYNSNRELGRLVHT